MREQTRLFPEIPSIKIDWLNLKSSSERGVGKQRILEGLKGGLTFHEAALSAGVDPAKARKWLERDPDFERAVVAALKDAERARRQ